MKRFMAKLEYDGTNYSGFQIQPNVITIQEVIERSLSRLLNHPVKVVASGRTDTAVSARGQVIHFDSDTTIPAGKIPYALESLLPLDISMTNCMEVDSNFHARYSVKCKTYSYTTYISKLNRPLHSRCYQYPYSIDINKIKKAAEGLIGTHDFKAFMATGSSVQGTIRQITDINITAKAEILCIEVTGNGFLYNMVRIIVGTLLDIGRGHLPPSVITAMLASGDRRLGGHTAHAIGLCLEKVEYNCLD